jgi:hypothetical protein
MGTLCLLNQSIPRMTSMPFEFKTIRLATKSTPPYFKVQLMSQCLPDTSFLRSLTSIQNNIGSLEYLRGYMVNLSSNVVLLLSAMVGFPRRFSVSGHRW